MSLITALVLYWSSVVREPEIYVAPDPPSSVEIIHVTHEEALEELEEWKESKIPDYRDTENVKQLVIDEFGEGHMMVRVADCESKFRQFQDNGEPLWNEQGSSAVGVFQIMDSIHRFEAQLLGLDIVNNARHNVAFAIVLYNEMV